MQFDMITSQARLKSFIQTIDNSTLSIDTEFVRTRTYVANLGLLQLNQNNKITLIDPILVPDLSTFWKKLDSKKCLLHASGEDLEIIRQHKGDLNFTLFDTQIACAFLNLGASLGYAKMVELLREVIVDKGESRADWCIRPLGEKQLNYAATDVLHLPYCFSKLKEKLIEKKMYDFFLDECRTTLEDKMKTQNPDNAYKLLNNLFKLDRQALAIAKEIAKWRLLTAKQRNLPLNFVLKSDHIWLIAYYQPKSIADLHRLHLMPNEIRIHGSSLIKIIERVLTEDPKSYPHLVSRLIDFPAYKKTLQSIRVKVKHCAEQYQLPIELIASKRVINNYLSWLWKIEEDHDQLNGKPKLLKGWRFELIGHQLEH